MATESLDCNWICQWRSWNYFHFDPLRVSFVRHGKDDDLCMSFLGLTVVVLGFGVSVTRYGA